MKYPNKTPGAPHTTPSWTVFLLTVVLASAIDVIASSLLQNPNLSRIARLAIALLPLPGDVALIALVLLRIRRLDDFQKRVHFEAVTVAFLSTGVAVFVYGYLQKAHLVGSLNAGLVWAFMLVFYAAGYFIAASHYR
jgi:hypothetical protein